MLSEKLCIAGSDAIRRGSGIIEKGSHFFLLLFLGMRMFVWEWRRYGSYETNILFAKLVYMLFLGSLNFNVAAQKIKFFFHN